MDNLSLSLQITLIGMSLVFGVILLLWIIMAVLVRLTPDKEEAAEPATAVAAADQSGADAQRRRRAAAAAVAVAIAHAETPTLHEFPEPPPVIVSAWQAVQRSRLLSQRGPRQK